jgi:DNA modification methylase
MIKLCDTFKEIQTIGNDTIDLILTDTPYGINHNDGFIKASKSTKAIKNNILNDMPYDILWDVLLDEFYRILKPGKMCYLFGRTDMFMRIGNNILNSKLKFNHDFIWRKGDMVHGNLGIFGTIHELLIGLSKGNPETARKVIIDGISKKRTKAEYCGKVSRKEYYGHPTQKPVGLLSYIILSRTSENDVVFDPFCGVGSTLVACNVLNRQSIGYELDKEFYDLSIKRLSDKEHLKQYEKLKNGELRNIPINGLTFNY